MAHSRKLLTIIILFALAISVSAPAWAFDETHLKKLKALNACEVCDLSGAKFMYADLIGTKLVGENLTGANISAANLTGADWSALEKVVHRYS